MATKKATKKASKKATTKKATTKKAATKKAATKKATTKKAATKKAATKKAATKKTATKKAATKKTATTTAQSARAVPAVGTKAPIFSALGDDGQMHSLSDHAGAPVVVYFYPKDDTPGCTTEACGFRDHMGRVVAAGAVVYGVSRDSVASHQRFKAKYGLNFTLLSDPDLTLHRAFGAWGTKNMYGKVVEGTIRSTFVIGRDGHIARAWPTVKVDGHVDEVLSALPA